MRLVLHKKSEEKLVGRLKKKVRIRKKISGTADKPRLCVFRSSKHIYASLINDQNGETISSFSSLSVKDNFDGKKMAEHVGVQIAKLAIEKKIEAVVFDRNGFLYHGRIKSLADGARHGGLKF